MSATTDTNTFSKDARSFFVAAMLTDEVLKTVSARSWYDDTLGALVLELSESPDRLWVRFFPVKRDWEVGMPHSKTNERVNPQDPVLASLFAAVATFVRKLHETDLSDECLVLQSELDRAIRAFYE